MNQQHKPECPRSLEIVAFAHCTCKPQEEPKKRSCCEMCFQKFNSGLTHCLGIATCPCHQPEKENPVAYLEGIKIPPKAEESGEEEFKIRFRKFSNVDNDGYAKQSYHYQEKFVIAFLEQAIEVAVEKERERIGKWDVESAKEMEEMVGRTRIEERTRILELLKGMEESKNHLCGFNSVEKRCDCYSTALEDVRKKLSENS